MKSQSPFSRSSWLWHLWEIPNPAKSFREGFLEKVMPELSLEGSTDGGTGVCGTRRRIAFKAEGTDTQRPRAKRQQMMISRNKK